MSEHTDEEWDKMLKEAKMPSVVSDSLDPLVGFWTNGSFTIEWQDEDVVKVTKHWSEYDEEALVDGGDFETILESLFVGARISRKHNDKMTFEGEKQ